MMKRHAATLVLAVVMGVLGFAVSGVAVAGVSDKPSSPPGQGECEHGNSEKPCKEDPQPDKGKDCELHGNSGGVNEDHCKGDETTPDETTPNETTPDETTPTESTPTDTTPQETVPNGGGNTPSEPSKTSSESGSSQATDSNSAPVAETSPTQTPEASDDSPQPAAEIVGKPPVAAPTKKQAAVLSVTANAPKPTRQAQEAPLTL
jgi:hypothetical protein